MPQPHVYNLLVYKTNGLTMAICAASPRGSGHGLCAKSRFYSVIVINSFFLYSVHAKDLCYLKYCDVLLTRRKGWVPFVIFILRFSRTQGHTKKKRGGRPIDGRKQSLKAGGSAARPVGSLDPWGTWEHVTRGMNVIIVFTFVFNQMVLG